MRPFRRLLFGHPWFSVLLLSAGVLPVQLPLPAATLRALPPGQLPDDHRLQPLKDLNGYFPFHPPASKSEWEARAHAVRRQMRVALGIWPMPTKTPLHAVVYGRISLGSYTVEKVYFQSLPGFYVSGNLYRPVGRTGKLPAVLSPHGHWSDGRFHDMGLAAVRRQIVQGAERFEDGGRNPLQSRCVQLARMGCVVFHYDMIGYADSQQIPMEIAHGFSRQRPEMNTLTNWGLFSPQAEAHLESVMGLQTIDSIRALDFLLSLPDVDPTRVAVTGASGGGTQTFILCGVDPRPTVSFPAVMVSTAMQGGCTCENASLLRVGTGNVEFAALFAPKPLGMTAAHDWTQEMPTKGYPQLQQLYRLLGAPSRVHLTPLVQFPHNYNYVSRNAMYRWLNRYLHLGWQEPIVEEDYPRLAREQLTVWDHNHPAPKGGPDFERALLRWWTRDAQKQITAARASWSRYRHLIGGALGVLFGRDLQSAGQVVWKPSRTEDRGAYSLAVGLLHNTRYHEELPTIMLRPKTANGQSVVWLDPAGKAGLFKPSGQPKMPILELLNRGTQVVGVDLLFQGEFLKPGEEITRTRKVNNPREAPAYTFGYNRSLFAHRVQDVLSVIQYLRHSGATARQIALVGLHGTGPLAAAARAQCGSAVALAVIDTRGFRFGRLLDWRSPDFLPGGAKYDDLPGMLALATPGRLWLAGEGDHLPAAVRTAYRQNGALDRVKLYRGPLSGQDQGAVKWLEASLSDR